MGLHSPVSGSHRGWNDKCCCWPVLFAANEFRSRKRSHCDKTGRENELKSQFFLLTSSEVPGQTEEQACSLWNKFLLWHSLLTPTGMHLFSLGLKRHLEYVSVTFSAEQFDSTDSKQTSPAKNFGNHTKIRNTQMKNPYST